MTKNQLFSFDVTLKDLMNLGRRAKEVPKLGAIFSLLKIFWYKLDDKERAKERWGRIRVGSVDLFIDDEDHLHMDFVTRFHFGNARAYLEAFKLIAGLGYDEELPDYLEDFDEP
jgi:hypothetical protein